MVFKLLSCYLKGRRGGTKGRQVEVEGVDEAI